MLTMQIEGAAHICETVLIVLERVDVGRTAVRESNSPG